MINSSTRTPDDHAGVWFPPPLIYVVLFGCGLALDRVVALAFSPSVGARIVALIGLAASLCLLVWSNILFQRAHTSRVTIRPARALVLDGPYRFTRNPMYVGLLGVYLAVALWFGSTWALLLAPLLVLAVHMLVIVREERYLERAFGQTYQQYRARVRPWL